MAFCKCFVYDKVVDPAQYKVVVYELHGAAEVFHMAFNFADGGFNGVRVPFHIPGAPVFKGYFHAGRPKFFKKFRQLPYNVRTCATGILICNVYELGSVFRVFGPFIAGQLVYFLPVSVYFMFNLPTVHLLMRKVYLCTTVFVNTHP